MENSMVNYQRFLDGDEDALNDLVSEYKDGLLWYLNSIVSDVNLAEDAMLDTFVKLIVKRPRFAGDSGFKTWLYAIARNVAYDSLRKKKKTVPLDEVENYIPDTDDIEELCAADERRRIVADAMRKLKSEHEQALRLVYFQDFTNAEAAKIMKKTRHQFDSLLYRAKEALARELGKGGFCYEEYK